MRLAMRRLTKTLFLTIALLALSAPMAFAQASGEGAYGETDDKVVTNAAFIVIAFFPVLVLVVSLPTGIVGTAERLWSKWWNR